MERASTVVMWLVAGKYQFASGSLRFLPPRLEVLLRRGDLGGFSALRVKKSRGKLTSAESSLLVGGSFDVRQLLAVFLTIFGKIIREFHAKRRPLVNLIPT